MLDSTVQYVARVLHFSASSLTRGCRRRVIVIGLFVCVCVCMCVCVCYCYSLQWHTFEDSWSLRRKEHIEPSARIKRFARKLFDGRDTTVQSKKKTLIFAHHNISSVTPIHYNTCVLDSNMRSLPKRSNSTDKQSVCVCLFLHNLGECFFSLLVEPIASKNVGYSNK